MRRGRGRRLLELKLSRRRIDPEISLVDLPHKDIITSSQLEAATRSQQGKFASTAHHSNSSLNK